MRVTKSTMILTAFGLIATVGIVFTVSALEAPTVKPEVKEPMVIGDIAIRGANNREELVVRNDLDYIDYTVWSSQRENKTGVLGVLEADHLYFLPGVTEVPPQLR